VFYDTRQRRYEASASFSPIFGTPSLEAWLERSRRAGLAIEVLPTLDRPLDADLMARLYRAIRDRVTVHVAYQTMRRATAEDRILTPTAFVSDGQRWHVRAYCHLREAYRDFVLSRIALSPDQSQSGVRAAELRGSPSNWPRQPISRRTRNERSVGTTALTANSASPCVGL
jgi:predicted DNA-binding transcriptional regulator YafY